ncbi:hypothetical protein CsatB_012634 [Cannabis sativa]|uniref:Rapid ALkalinization Factor n=1 Tax=Cannabis sativa TaxID=3483 RepID=A0A7J6GAV6_CANSA|nr:hypothetical protein G4B88_010653 [Cannabis sativa]
MGILKRKYVMLIVSVVVAMMLMEGGLSSKIGYGAIEHGGEQKPCKGPKCLPGSSNGYNRGCEKGSDCRKGGHHRLHHH